ncbi:MAG: hypothetical protein Fur0021_20160 [Candidatus Promineifilaceae bacterium]
MKRRALPLLAGIAALLIFFHKLAFTNLILARGDVFLYFYPYWHAAAAALRAGRVPLWNPHLFMGAPFLANSQAGVFYPLNWLLWWLLPTPYAVSAAILLHLAIAGIGVYFAARRLLHLAPPAAWLSAVLFALGGYLTAQVEHVNQLQGLAWLPWFLVALAPAPRWSVRRRALAVAALFALQLLAGHTQTAFITGVGLLLWLAGGWLLGDRRPAGSRRQAQQALLALLPGALFALLLAAVQLLPTLELTRLSSRQGGLPFAEVVSFSWHPLLLARSLLPAYGSALFTEYTAFLPLTAWLLVLVAIPWSRQNRAAHPQAIALVWLLLLTGLLALGQFTPLYWALARLPGFNLFRVPARWLVWVALAAALLAAHAWQWFYTARPIPRRWWGVAGVALLALMVWGALAVPLSRWLPLGAEAPAEAPALRAWIGWSLELLLAAALLWLGRHSTTSAQRWRLALLPLMVAALYFASRSQPYNNPTAPAAVFDRRPPVTRLQALAPSLPASPPDRFLSLSPIFFDLGDQAELDTIYGDQLPASARYDYTIAAKQQEILAPNLSLLFDLAAVDGFDGGLLPLVSYSETVRGILPAGETAADGRLRERLAGVPPAAWLDLFQARYVITDKVGDEWRQGVFFDRQHPVTVTPDAPLTVAHIPDFPAAELWLLAESGDGMATVTLADGRQVSASPQLMSDGLWRVSWQTPVQVTAITLTTAANAPWSVAALTLVNPQDETFHSLVPAPFRLIYSGDVKIYQKLDVLPRAYLVSDWQWQPDVPAAVAAMQAPGFAPRQQAILVGTPPSDFPAPAATAVGVAAITHYAPERVLIHAQTSASALLILSDAAYPGWTAAIDGQETEILIANGMFRALLLPAGNHEIAFHFRPASYFLGRWISLLSWLFLLILAPRNAGILASFPPSSTKSAKS